MTMSSGIEQFLSSTPLTLLFNTNFQRLLDVVHNDSKLYLVFEFLDLDLKRYMDSVKDVGFTPSQVKVYW